MTTVIKPNITLRQATAVDISDLVTLNRNWYKANLDNFDHGFLSVTYDSSFFDSIISNNDIFVFHLNNKLLGYVLVNTVLETDHIKNIRQQYFYAKPDNSTRKIAFSYQILIDTELHGTGFFYEAQNTYGQFFKTKYDLLVSTVSKENLRSVNAHKKAGWTFIDTTNNYFIIELTL
jgi:RimJ/RimL family protein N-acetyltransferase